MLCFTLKCVFGTKRLMGNFFWFQVVICKKVEIIKINKTSDDDKKSNNIKSRKKSNTFM